MKNFNISPDENLTLGAVKELTSQGNEITLTPHIGNIWRQNMAVADLGVNVVVYEGNCHLKDLAEYPGFLRIADQLTPMVEEERPVMSTHLKLSPNLQIDYLANHNLGHTPAQIHYNAMRQALPPQQLALSADYFYTSNPLIKEMLTHLVGHHHAFNRKLNLEGVISAADSWEQSPNKLVENFMEIKHAQINAVLKGETPEQEGPLASNCLNIMMLGIIAFLEKQQNGALSKPESQKFTAYAISGKDMINYTKDHKMQDEIRTMYGILRDKFTFLPESIELKMLPGSNLKFATPSNEVGYDLIKRVGIQNIKIEEAQGQIKFISPEKKAGTIAVVNELRAELNKLIDDVWALAPWKTFYSQHDAICNGGRPRLPEEIHSMSFKKLGILVNPK